MNQIVHSQTFGHFVEAMPDDVEYLIIGFSANSIPLKQRWRNNGLSADFIADYLQAFFVGLEEKFANDAKNDAVIPAKSKNAAKYIANELLENAMKFSDDSIRYQTKIAFHLYGDKLVFHVVNAIKSEDVENFQKFIKRLLAADDPNELYIQQMELNASGENEGGSGLGFLSMMCDYSAKLGWRFETFDAQPPVVSVTTMVSLAV